MPDDVLTRPQSTVPTGGSSQDAADARDLAGLGYQWTKYLSNRAYSWMTGWVYLFAGILTVTGVVATVPGLVLIPLLNNLGIGIENIPRNQIIIALLVLASTTLLNVFGVRLVALINNTGVVFE